MSSKTAYPYNQLDLYLIKPSKYDDDGYVIRHWKGVLPSNTLACLNGLSEDLRKRGSLGSDLKFNIWNIDETVEQVKLQMIIRRSQMRGTKTLVCLLGVQSNQFPRASDLALSFRKSGIDVLIGGFHVSGVLSMLPELPPEVAALRDAGVSIVAGEVEGRWEMILRDALEERLKPVYNFLKDTPELLSAPMPVFPKNLLRSYAVRHFATLDCGRGCPFACSFCTVINVQGRVMRLRPVASILKMIRENYLRHKISFYFFTDDNFSRNNNWCAIFEALIRLRREEKIPISFMIQVDTQSHRIPGFVSKAAAAGCSQVFIGLESVNEKNLEIAGKKQNKVHEFRGMITRYQEAGISAHLAYIIGFPFDSEESVARDIARLQEELNAPQASFFMLTPLPGSSDHKTALSRGTLMDADLNNFDAFHETFRHERMQSGGWSRAYESAWRNYYSVPNMIRILRRSSAKKYWDNFSNFIWYKNAIEVEGGHPMLHGFLRLKGRLSRRSIYPVETRWNYFLRRVRDFKNAFLRWIKLALEMEEVWLATRQRSALEQQVIQEVTRLRVHLNEWRDIKLSELQLLYRKASEVLKHSPSRPGTRLASIPSRFELWIQKWNVFSDSLTFTREPMTRFWRKTLKRFKSGDLHRIYYPKAAFMGFRESVLFARFLLSFLSSFSEEKSIA